MGSDWLRNTENVEEMGRRNIVGEDGRVMKIYMYHKKEKNIII